MRFRRLLLMCLLICAVANAKKFPLAAAPSIPAARGDVEINHDKNGNTKFKIKVQHLATPDALTPPKAAYIVWLRERDGNASPQGQLRVDKKLNGTPLPPYNGKNHGNGFEGSGILALGGPLPSSVKITFTKPGAYNFECVIHEGMDGKVTVTP